MDYLHEEYHINIHFPVNIIPLDTPIIAQNYCLINGSHKIGKNGNERLEFNHINGICLSNNLFICDSTNDRIQVLDNNFEFLYSFGSKGNEIYNFDYPFDIRINHNDQIIISDSKNDKIQIFNSAFEYMYTINIHRPYGIEVLDDDKLWIASIKDLCLFDYNERIDKICVNDYIGSIAMHNDTLFVNSINNVYSYTNNKLVKYDNTFKYLWFIKINKDKLYACDKFDNKIRIYQI